MYFHNIDLFKRRRTMTLFYIRIFLLVLFSFFICWMMSTWHPDIKIEKISRRPRFLLVST